MFFVLNAISVYTVIFLAKYYLKTYSQITLQWWYDPAGTERVSLRDSAAVTPWPPKQPHFHLIYLNKTTSVENDW